MRITKAILEEEIRILKVRETASAERIYQLKDKIRLLSIPLRGNETLTVALERSTDALAHVIAELLKRR